MWSLSNPESRLRRAISLAAAILLRVSALWLILFSLYVLWVVL